MEFAVISFLRKNSTDRKIGCIAFNEDGSIRVKVNENWGLCEHFFEDLEGFFHLGSPFPLLGFRLCGVGKSDHPTTVTPLQPPT